MRWTLRLATIRGIPLQIHVTLLAALPAFAFAMATTYFSAGEGWPNAWGWTWGILLAVALFGSVLLHEIAHSLMALREGARVRSITLPPIGGISSLETMPRSPRQELKITLVGPLTNVVLAAPPLLLAYAGLVPSVPPRSASYP